MADKPKSEIQAFRAALAKLKKLDLLPYKVRDVRQEVPTPALTKAIKKYAGILKGTETALSKKELHLTNRDAAYRRLRVVKPTSAPARVLVPHFKDEKVTAEAGAIKYDSPEGIRRLELPRVRTDTTGHFMGDLKKKIGAGALPDKLKGQLFAARFFNGRTQLFTSLKDLLNTLHAYDSVVRAHGRKQTAEIIRNLEIITVPDMQAGAWFAAKRAAKIATAKAREKARPRRKRK